MTDVPGGSQQVGGDTAHSSTDSGKPVKIGGVFVGDPGPVSEGERVNAYFNAYGAQRVTFYSAERIQGSIGHDGAGSGVNPVKQGYQAENHGADPTEVDENDITNATCDLQGMPYGMLGHPNVIVREWMTTAVQTNDPIIDTVGANDRVIVLLISAVVSDAATASPQIRIGFGTTAVPTEPTSGNSVIGMVLSHGGIAPGSGMVKGTGGARVAVGGKDEELRITNAVPTGGKITVEVHYYIITET